MSFRSESATFHGTVRVALPVGDAFPLFSPVGEKEWVPGWNPELLHPEGIDWCEGQVFRTVHTGDESVWFVAQLDREAHSVAYHRVDLGLSATSVAVVCRAADARSTLAEVTYRFVGLTERGNESIRQQTKASFDEKWVAWEKNIAEAIARR